MKLAKLIESVVGLNHSSGAPSASPIMESMEGRMLMSATMITDGTSNTVMADALKAGGEQQPYLTYKLKSVYVTSYQL